MGGHILGKYAPKNSPKMGRNRQVQAKMLKNKNHHISTAINRTKIKFDDEAETNNYTSWVV